MTDINEAIARWMGWTGFIDQMGVTHAVPPYVGGGTLKEAIPRYTESLDAQVPVWEALKEKHDRNFYLEVAGDTFCAGFEDLTMMEYGSTPAEAAARAIHAALVALGEVEE